MGDNNRNGGKILKKVLDDLATSYVQRDKSVDFASWLTDSLVNEIPDITAEVGRKLAQDIISAVGGYDEKLESLNNAIESGVSKEEWLADQYEQEYADMDPAEAGAKLEKVETALFSTNAELMGDELEIRMPVDVQEDNQWNKYSLRNKSYEIGEQASLMGNAAVASAISSASESAQILPLNDAPKDELKAVVAGAVKVAAEQGLGFLMPEEASPEVVGNIAGIAVEGASAFYDAAVGGISMTEAIDRTGRAATVVLCKIGQAALQGVVFEFGGPVLTNILGGLIEHIGTKAFADNVYNVIRDTTKVAWEGIKDVAKSSVNFVKNMVTE